MARPLSIQDAKIAIDDLFRQALATDGRKTLKDILGFAVRLCRFSAWNALMVEVQRPGAVAVASRSSWRKHGRAVINDAIPIVILLPFGPIGLVHEFGDTVPVDPHAVDENCFGVAGYINDARLTKLITAAGEKDAVWVELVPYGKLLDGSAIALPTETKIKTPFITDTKVRYRVRLDKALDVATKFTVLAHELAHIYCGHQGKRDGDWWEERKGPLSTTLVEMEAEAAAYLVAKRAGLEPPSAQYLSCYMEDLRDVEGFSLDAVVRAASRIERLAEKPSSGLVSWARKKKTQPSFFIDDVPGSNDNE